jgi:RNA polymerase-binding transcription factor DksA
MLSKNVLNKIKEKLLHERQTIEEKSIQRPDIDTDGDEIDEIQGNLLIELQNQLNIRNNNKLHQINDALKRLDEKTYGVCLDCEEDIPEKRLSINPYILTCVSCAEIRESDNKHRKGF